MSEQPRPSKLLQLIVLLSAGGGIVIFIFFVYQCVAVYLFLQAMGAHHHHSSSYLNRYRKETREKLSQIYHSLIQYTQDHAGKLPSMQDLPTVQRAVAKYTSHPDMFVCSTSQSNFLPNPLLASHKLKHFSAPRQIVLFYEPASPYHALLFLDGHYGSCDETSWPEFKQAYRLP